MGFVLSKEQKERVRVLCKTENLPIPTLLLFSVGFLAFSSALYLGWLGHTLLGFYLAMFGQYLLYTCMHEAVHRVANPSRFLNWIIGVISSSAFFAPFSGFRYVHLKHHRFTNHREKDPDVWSARSILVFRWFTQDIYYLFVFIRDGGFRFVFFYRVVLQYLCLIPLLALMVHLRGWAWPLCCWLLPARFVVAWLSFVFNYLPHHPHDPEIQDTAIKDTSARTSPFLGILLIGQNFHNIHHLYPAAPFFRYAAIWREVGPELRRNGAVVKERIFEL